MKKSFVEMRYRNASIDYIEELGDMETTGRAVTYDNSSFADRINEFRKNYDSLPELLKKQRRKNGMYQFPDSRSCNDTLQQCT